MHNEAIQTFKAKKILFVIDSLYTSNNGTSVSAQRYAAELRRRGHIVRALCGDKPKTEQDKSITDGDYCTGIFRFPVFQFLCEKHDFYYANADANIIRRACEWADIVHVFTPFFLGNAAIRCCELIPRPVTAAFHVQPENITSSFGMGKVTPINNMIYSIFRHFTYSRVRHIHVPSQFIADELAQHAYTARTHVISNGIHDAFMQAGERKFRVKSLESGERGGSNVESSKSVFKIMMVGRLSKEKRQDVIINAVKQSRYADRIQVVFAGRGPEHDKYVELGKDLKHQPQFIYVGRDELIENLLDTDLYIHASDMESEAISCIEAFATGLVPVIADSKVSATPQFALDKRSLFRAGDPQDLARAIDYWLDHPEEKARMEQRYAEAARQYTLRRLVERFEQMLDEEIRTARRKLNVGHKQTDKHHDNNKTIGHTTRPVRHSTGKSRHRRRVA